MLLGVVPVFVGELLTQIPVEDAYSVEEGMEHAGDPDVGLKCEGGGEG